MDIITAIKHAIDGNALLFIGSGASAGANPLEGDKFLTGRELALLLSSLAGLTPATEDLNFASQRYRKVKGDVDLVDLLHKLFTASKVSEEHKRLSEINWNGIYTTNYDNVLERAFSERRKKLTPLIPSQDTKDYTIRTNTVLHINGYIDSLTPASLNEEFKLTNTSYLTESFSKSNWSFVFRRNLETARAIIFVGYSMYDLDIQRIMYGGDSLKNKTIFIERAGKTQTEIESSLQVDFGEIFPIGLEGFWAEYDKIALSYIPQDLTDTYFAFEELHRDLHATPLRDDDIFNLLLWGKVHRDAVWNAATGSGYQPYFIVRDQIKDGVELIDSNLKTLVAVADLANGKTLFCLGLACKLTSQGYRTFWLKDDVEDIADEIERLCKIPGKVLVVIENYTRRLNEIRHFQARRGAELLLILSAKSSLHEVYQESLLEIIDPSQSAELDLNTLSNYELQSVDQVLSTYKLWGEKDAWSSLRKIKFLREDCARQLSAVLLDVVNSPAIQSRFHHLFNVFHEKSELADVIVAASVLKLLGFDNPSAVVISEILDSSYLYSFECKNNEMAREILFFSADGIIPRSSIIAKYGLTSHSDARQLVDRLIRIATNAHDKGSSSSLYFGIYKDLVTFSIIQPMLPKKGLRDSLIRFYEGMKNVRAARNHPHFWLQYAIARLASDRPEDLQMAKRFLDSAYAHAQNRTNYHTKHMDNVLARYWIQHSITLGEIGLAMNEFSEGHALLLKQARTESNNSPYKVANMYITFYNAKKHIMTKEQKITFKRMAYNLIELIPRLPQRVQVHSTVKLCFSNLQSIIVDIDATI